MRIFRFIGWLELALALAACSQRLPFSEYQRTEFAQTAVTQSTTRVIRLENPSSIQPQHVRSIAFDAGGNPGGNFQLSKVVVGGRAVAPRDIIVPANGVLELHLLYAPRSLETTQATFGGVESGAPPRIAPQAPAEKSVRAGQAAAFGMQRLLGGKAAAVPLALHRGLLVMTYDQPNEGLLQLELVGTAALGPNGEVAISGAGECVVDGSTACFSGVLRITMPGVVDTAQETELSGKWALQIDAGTVRADMARFPVALFVISGDQLPSSLPVAALSIAISGDDKTVAEGTFDGQSLQIERAAFRARIYTQAETVESIADKAALIDFVIPDITITTASPLDGNQIMLAVDTTLGPNPTGVPLGDQALGGKQIKVEIAGTLALP